MDDDFVNDDYDHMTPDIFYVPTNIPGKGCDLTLFDSLISTHCDCADQTNCTDPSICPCLRNTAEDSSNYQNKLLSDNKLLQNNASSSVIECNPRCGCSANCSNRLVQFGPHRDLEIIDVGAKGYGVVCKSSLQRGEFVCEYAGEIISDQEAVQRRKNDNNNYIFVLNEIVSGDKIIKTVIDATCIGNIGRYVNHSCNPNCIVVPVRVDSLVPRLAIFTRQNIPSGEEITYSYCSSASNQTACIDERKPCLCGEKNCAKFLPNTDI